MNFFQINHAEETTHVLSGPHRHIFCCKHFFSQFSSPLLLKNYIVSVISDCMHWIFQVQTDQFNQCTKFQSIGFILSYRNQVYSFHKEVLKSYGSWNALQVNFLFIYETFCLG